jgi:hypothetical protein
MHMQMLMKCLCSDLGMLMHACMQSWSAPPPTALLYFLLHRVIALALYKGLHAAEAKSVQKGGCRAGPDSRALRVELAEMLNIP